MAGAPGHRFGQIIGQTLEAAILPLVEQFAREHDLYLDKKGSRPSRPGVKCTWLDANGNAHDLDYVLERGGAEDKIGMPAAFIEIAWRRYTKHSRNKAQEIQGAIEPLAAAYRYARPFKGAILAGVFTAGAIQQLRSHGFNVLYLPDATIVAAFAKCGIDAKSDETTTDEALQARVDQFNALSKPRRARLTQRIVANNSQAISTFLLALAQAIGRQVEQIIVLPLHGEPQSATTIMDAIQLLESYHEHNASRQFQRYEIEVRYNNGETVHGRFNDKLGAIEFLRGFQPITAPATEQGA